MQVKVVSKPNSGIYFKATTSKLRKKINSCEALTINRPTVSSSKLVAFVEHAGRRTARRNHHLIGCNVGSNSYRFAEKRFTYIS